MIRATELLLELKDLGDIKRASSMRQYMRNKFDFLGISSPLRKEAIKEYLRDSKKLSVTEINDDVALWWDDRYRESQYIGTDLLIRNKKRLREDQLEFIEDLIIEKSWWDTVDALASHIIGSIFYRFDEARLQYSKKWLNNENMWLNRTCLLYQLKYGKESDMELLFSYIQRLKHKEDFFIQKAIGWSLRQGGKSYPAEVRSFIDQNQLSKLAFKEASRLLPN